MNKVLFGLTLLAAGLQATDVSAQPGRFDDDRREAVEHGWMFNYNEARQLARNTNRPLMIVFRCVP